VLPIKGFIKIFDFRKGEDFNQQVGWNQRFSSLIGDFIVVDVYPGFNFFRKQRNALLHDAQLRLDDLVRLAIERAPVGFVAVSGGPTESERVIRENVSEFTKQADASLFGYFAPEDAAKQLRLRREQIAYQTWLVGGCGSKFDRRRLRLEVRSARGDQVGFRSHSERARTAMPLDDGRRNGRKHLCDALVGRSGRLHSSLRRHKGNG
jgi:hypothetical protein